MMAARQEKRKQMPKQIIQSHRRHALMTGEVEAKPYYRGNHEQKYGYEEHSPQLIPLAEDHGRSAQGCGQQHFQLASAPPFHKEPAGRPAEQTPFYN